MKKVMTVLGAAVAGFAAGILTAPKSGKETREDLKKKAKEAQKVAEKKAKEAQKVAEDGVKTVKSVAKKVGDAANETVRDAKGNVEKRFGGK